MTTKTAEAESGDLALAFTAHVARLNRAPSGALSLDDIAALDDLRREVRATVAEALVPLARELVELRKLRDQERRRHDPSH